MDISRIYIGGWFQRTSLHLSETYDFLRGRESPLKLDPGRLRAFRERLSVSGLELIVEDLERIERLKSSIKK